MTSECIPIVREPRKLHERMLHDTLAGIVRGDFAPSGRLPREVDLAKAHGVSRYVARECIQALADRGVVTVTHGVGARVAPVADWHLFDPLLLAALAADPAGREHVQELQECRRILWPEVAALAAVRRTDDDLTRLADAETRRAEFLHAVLRAARNRFLARALAPLETAVDRDDRHPDAAGARADLLRAIAARDSDASRSSMRALVDP
jgi:DNA-binding FadR family transcriptional regulator